VIAGLTFDVLGGWPLIPMLLIFGPALLLGTLFGTLFGWVGGPGWSTYDLFRIVNKGLPENNYYGLCTGRKMPESATREALTDWLSEQIDHLSGKTGSEPLTFGNLRKKEIILRMVTTNLSHGEPYVFPRDKNTFLFNEDEMADFFPENVVTYLKEAAHKSKKFSLPEKFHFLPPGDKLPIVVAMRLSLSYPILLSAVPLYSIDTSAFEDKEQSKRLRIDRKYLRKNWFSDGGICINFPIGFYDAWFPTRPTFGINLTSLSEERKGLVNSVEAPEVYVGESSAGGSVGREANVTERVFLPKPNEPGNPEWQEISGLFQFGSAILSSAMNFRDAMQARLPSYRERVVQIRLAKDEGGRNLDMPEETVEFMESVGEMAAQRLRDEFMLDHHQWVRLRILMEQLEANLKGISETFNTDVVEKHLVGRQKVEDFPYDIDDEQWCKKAQEYVEQLHEFMQRWPTPTEEGGTSKDASEDSHFFRPISNAEPQPELRITPRT
jgi:predicted acylesterase/phospholipase RssA